MDTNTESDTKTNTDPTTNVDSATPRDTETPADVADTLDAAALDREAAARSGIYAMLATLFDEPDKALYDRLASGAVNETCAELVAASGLDVTPPDLTVAEDHETICARFNDLFTIGYAEYTDRTDGSLHSDGPPVSLYGSSYRPDASWNDVNLDLARAYDYFGLTVDQSARDNHDYLPYQLEFAGYLARREADSSPDAGRARLDFHDRHLHVVADGLAERMADERGTGLYGELAAFLGRFVTADQTALAERFEGGGG
ncbi:DMSO reductase type II enzyme chaperone [Halogeometricum borinquense DSM 11551]|uniref:DMSO reductase family type II enzyme chaperone n=1 Tax=Halogeometricum borinquense (strain ATCC 700274 / DSM 11551 / JCM 10706 / KCTC 4070 / PR3) TaxID=469382 RepID=E4NV38_HALBP|nr:molecular chaperone TorD family protein [Halogeometricum borinquense]ADQ69027.1 DMSO reductase family type II enzyme chaperone [Halogeometricum borinquense DSM 11551]ELY29471.1 DMSO reductase type II enzyme chaperone [Halogeometricum borinquense DSM 11551]